MMVESLWAIIIVVLFAHTRAKAAWNRNKRFNNMIIHKDVKNSTDFLATVLGGTVLCHIDV